MADAPQLELLQQGVETWNTWRKEHPTTAIDLTAADLSGMRLNRIDLHGADLSNANLSGVKMRDADLRRAIFNHANLQHAVLSRSDLRKASLQSANLVQASFSWSCLDEANLKAANLSQARLRFADLNHALLWHAQCEKACFEHAHLWCAELHGANLRAADLSFANLRSTQLVHADLSFANLELSDLTYSMALGAKFCDAILEGTNMAGANIYTADFTGASIHQCVGAPDDYFVRLQLPKQERLIVTKYYESVWDAETQEFQRRQDASVPIVTVDDFLTGQLLSLLLDNPRLHHPSLALIVGYFADERFELSTMLRAVVQQYEHIPVVLNLCNVTLLNAEWLTRVSMLADMARFTIIDLTTTPTMPEQSLSLLLDLVTLVARSGKPLVPLIDEKQAINLEETAIAKLQGLPDVVLYTQEKPISDILSPIIHSYLERGA